MTYDQLLALLEQSATEYEQEITESNISNHYLDGAYDTIEILKEHGLLKLN